MALTFCSVTATSMVPWFLLLLNNTNVYHQQPFIAATPVHGFLFSLSLADGIKRCNTLFVCLLKKACGVLWLECWRMTGSHSLQHPMDVVSQSGMDRFLYRLLRKFWFHCNEWLRFLFRSPWRLFLDFCVWTPTLGSVLVLMFYSTFALDDVCLSALKSQVLGKLGEMKAWQG